jgi:multisubunit Na+/H+ antiporter MnhG subunit
MDTHTIKGVRTMDILLLNARTARKQATGIQTKKIACSMHAICSLLFWMSGHVVLILFMFIIGPAG